MPELPEVETIKNDLREKIVDKKISDIEIFNQKIIRNLAKYFNEKLIKKCFTNIERRGKLIIFKIDNNFFLLVHLRMTGQLIYQNKKEIIAGGHEQKALAEKLPNKHTHVAIKFADNSILYYNDLRRFGFLKIVDKEELVRELKKFGPEPLSKDFDVEYFKEKLKNKNIAIKKFLLDQKNIAGIGNIYADEVLFAAQILPNRRAGSLNGQEIELMVGEIKKILLQAIKFRGTTFNNYRDSMGKRGNFSQRLKVYGHGGEKCEGCGGLLQKIKIGGRGTVYCEKCQK